MMSNERPDAGESITYDEETDTYRAAFDYGETRPSTVTVHVLACACDKEPLDFTPLNESIDPDAIDRLITPQNPEQFDADRAITFTHQGHEVTVKSCGLIKVEPLISEK